MARPPVVRAQPFRHVRERQARRAASARPAPRRDPAPPNPRADRRRRGSRSPPRRACLQLVADRLPRLRRQAVRRRVPLDVGHGIERGLGVARAGQHPGEIARLGRASRDRRPADAARPAAGTRARISSRRGNRGPPPPRRACDPRPRSGLRRGYGGRRPATRLSDGLSAAASPACRSCDSCMTVINDSLAKWNLSALSIPGRACYISAAVCKTPAARIGAGWSSPVARQAHNLKVVGSNPTPATK